MCMWGNFASHPHWITLLCKWEELTEKRAIVPLASRKIKCIYFYFLLHVFIYFATSKLQSKAEQTDRHDIRNGLRSCCLKSLTMYKWAIKPFDVVTIRIHNHNLIAADWHGQQKDCTKRHCQGKGAQPKPTKSHVLNINNEKWSNIKWS